MLGINKWEQQLRQSTKVSFTTFVSEDEWDVRRWHSAGLATEATVQTESLRPSGMALILPTTLGKNQVCWHLYLLHTAWLGNRNRRDVRHGLTARLEILTVLPSTGGPQNWRRPLPDPLRTL